MIDREQLQQEYDDVRRLALHFANMPIDSRYDLDFAVEHVRDYGSSLTNAMARLLVKMRKQLRDLDSPSGETTKFGVGEWRMRNGEKVNVRVYINNDPWPLALTISSEQKWTECGLSNMFSGFDLIEPWQESKLSGIAYDKAPKGFDRFKESLTIIGKYLFLIGPEPDFENWMAEHINELRVIYDARGCLQMSRLGIILTEEVSDALNKLLESDNA